MHDTAHVAQATASSKRLGMGCGSSVPSGAAGPKDELTILLMGIDNSGKTTLTYSLKSGVWGEGAGLLCGDRRETPPQLHRL